MNLENKAFYIYCIIILNDRNYKNEKYIDLETEIADYYLRNYVEIIKNNFKELK